MYGDNYSKIIEHSGIEKTPKEAVKLYIERIALFFTDNSIKLKCLYIFGQIYETKLNYDVNGHRGKSSQDRWCFCVVDNHINLH